MDVYDALQRCIQHKGGLLRHQPVMHSTPTSACPTDRIRSDDRRRLNLDFARSMPQTLDRLTYTVPRYHQEISVTVSYKFRVFILIMSVPLKTFFPYPHAFTVGCGYTRLGIREYEAGKSIRHGRLTRPKNAGGVRKKKSISSNSCTQ